MKVLCLILSLTTFAAAHVHLVKLRDVDLAGTLTGGLETDPIRFALNGIPITFGGAGQGDLTGAVKVHTPPQPEIVGPISPVAKRGTFQIIDVIDTPRRKVKWDWLGTPYW